MKILTLLLACSLGATTVTVCSSGCDYSNLQTALTATVSDCAIDVVEITAGQTFSGSYSLPPRPACSGVVQVRTSRYAELPPTGYRVGPEHATLMPTINANIADTPAIYAYAGALGENAMTGADTGTNIMTLQSAIANNQPFSCSYTPPAPLVAGTIYYALNLSGTTMRASLTPGGAAIDITDAGSTGAASYYQKPQCKPINPVRNWRLTGLNVTMPSGTSQQNSLIAIGNNESSTLSVPNNIWVDRCYVHGHDDMAANTMKTAVFVSGSNITVSGSYLSEIRWFSEETHGITGYNIPGPVMIENNSIRGGSLGILIGGTTYGPGIPENQSTNVTIRKNYSITPGKNMYREGAGAPTGSCYYGGGSGMFYRNTSSSGTTCSLSGRCYSCQSDNTWAIDTTATYRADDLLVKNPIELKEANGVTVDGNVWQGQQESMDTQSNCLQVAIGNLNYTNYARDLTYRNNWCTETWGGLSITSYSGLTAQSRNVALENNLITGMGSPQLLRVNGANTETVNQTRLPKWQGLRYDHNTHRPDASASINTGYGLYAESNTAVIPAYERPAYVQNNIWWYGTAGSVAEGGTSCNNSTTAWGAIFLDDGSKQVSSNVQFGGTSLGGLNLCSTVQNLSAVASIATVDFASDSSLNATSPYSASCSAGCSFVATDGGDVGVDRVRLNTALNGVTTGAPGMAIRMDLGSVGAIAHYTAPDNSACDVKLYTSWTARTTANLSADTNTSPEQLDSRTGSITSGQYRQLVLGVNSALTASTPYALVVTCGSTVALATFRTLAAGSGTYNVTVQLPTASASEYSSSADMSSPTVLSSSTAPLIPVPTGQVRYWRKTDGLISALIAR